MIDGPPSGSQVKQAPKPARPRRRLSSAAIASLTWAALGLLLTSVSVVATGLVGLLGVFLGVLALARIFRSGGRLTGYASASLGTTLSGLCVTVACFALLEQPLPHREFTIQNHVGQLCMVSVAYARQNNGAFPPADSWPQVLEQERYIVAKSDLFLDPADADAGRAYAMNAALSRVRYDGIGDPSGTVLIFECAPGSPPAGGPELLPQPPKHRGGHFIGFIDGHVEWVVPERVETLIWDPAAGPPAP